MPHDNHMKSHASRLWRESNCLSVVPMTARFTSTWIIKVSQLAYLLGRRRRFKHLAYQPLRTNSTYQELGIFLIGVARCAWLLISKDEQKKAGIQAVKKRESKNSKKWEGGEPVSIFLNSLINPPPRPLLKTVSRVKTSNIKISIVGGFHTLAMFVWLCTPAQPGDWRNCCASNP